jgi:hypothetical protein
VLPEAPVSAAVAERQKPAYRIYLIECQADIMSLLSGASLVHQYHEKFDTSIVPMEHSNFPGYHKILPEWSPTRKDSICPATVWQWRDSLTIDLKPKV